MKPLDDELRSALKRQEPPEGFAARVLNRLESENPEQGLPAHNAAWWRRPVLRWTAVVAACLLVVAGVARYQHRQREHARAEQASRQAVLALEIASAELRTALDQAQHITAQALAAPIKSRTPME
ncbi:MAG TPA: hypothetical protein VMW54_14730 [Terriglobia bacterium]|nr:hypothetical protein [Terriglobia bacterium]